MTLSIPATNPASFQLAANTEASNQDHFLALPAEITCVIFTQLPVALLPRLKEVSKSFNQVLTNNKDLNQRCLHAFELFSLNQQLESLHDQAAKDKCLLVIVKIQALYNRAEARGLAEKISCNRTRLQVTLEIIKTDLIECPHFKSKISEIFAANKTDDRLKIANSPHLHEEKGEKNAQFKPKKSKQNPLERINNDADTLKTKKQINVFTSIWGKIASAANKIAEFVLKIWQRLAQATSRA